MGRWLLGATFLNEKGTILKWDKTLLLCTCGRKTAYEALLVTGTKLAPAIALRNCFFGPKLVFNWFLILYQK